MGLQGALDNDILVATRKFLETGVPPNVDSLWTAIQRSNSSLKRKPKKVLSASLERVLDFLNISEEFDDDSEAAAEEVVLKANTAADLMNRSLRENLMPARITASPPPEDRKRRLANGEPSHKRQKGEKPAYSPPSDLSLADIGGMDDVIDQMERLLVLPLLMPETYHEMRARLPRGILLHGPPGCGKTMLSRAFAAEMGLPFVEILGPSIVSGMSGESEKGVRDRFEEAKRNAPCIIFIDEIDAIAPKRESSQSQMEKRIVAQLLVSMDELGRDETKPVIVLAATNRPDSIDPALRRGGRFDTEINISVPNERVREQIIKAQMKGTPATTDVDYAKLAKMTAGYVGADLQDLVGKAVSWQLNKYREALKRQAHDLDVSMEVDCESGVSPSVKGVRRLIARARRRDLPQPEGSQRAVSMEAFLAALPDITPSSKREGFATIPDVSWEDIGALKSVREELETAIVAPIREPELYAAVGISAPTGVLLWGPPGCGKTLLAKAVAAESKANFIAIKGPELINKFVGESEAAVRRVFTRARSSVPCVIFFDELDALVPRRNDAGSEASARVVNTLLTELDGLNERQGIYVIAATNRPDMIDEAMLRPGRLETPLFVDLPGSSERAEIMTALLRKKPVDNVAEIAELVRSEACNKYSGADLGALFRKAAQRAISRRDTRPNLSDFEYATTMIKGSVGDIAHYHALRKRFAQNY